MVRQHTDREYEAELSELRGLLLLMGARVEAQLAAAVASFVTADHQAAKRLIADDLEVDRLEVQVDEACVQLLAKRQPVARDLRSVMTTLKFVTDLERIGDLASNIGRVVLEGISQPESRCRAQTEELGKAVIDALRRAIDALVELDATRAESVIFQDRDVDDRCAALQSMISEGIVSRPADVQVYLRLLTVVRSLERVADHCTNLAEMVVFLVKGQDVRHLRRSSAEPSSPAQARAE